MKITHSPTGAEGASGVRLALSALVLAGCLTAAMVGAQQEAKPAKRWWKGNLHTHSLWSDGDDYPEMIADWYKQRGYHFLGLSDHNVLLQGERWSDPATNKGGVPALEKYRKRFGDWVEEKDMDGKRLVRLRPLPEFRKLFDEADRFLMIPSEEITDKFGKLPIHMNATNIRELVRPKGGSSVSEVIQNNMDSVWEQRKRTGQPMFPHLNHPNFGWAITAEDMMAVRGEKFFEVYNGHPTVYNDGDATHAGVERVWDILLTKRLAELNMEPMFGLATDDSHNYHTNGPNRSNPGRGWVWVNAPRLTPEAIVTAMEAGDFYSSSGVELADVRREGNKLAVDVKETPGVTYTIRFYGTRKGYDPNSEPVKDQNGMPLPVTRRYSEQIGAVLAEVKGTSATYTLKGDELYVRAKVISSRKLSNPVKAEDLESAWTQPLIPGK